MRRWRIGRFTECPGCGQNVGKASVAVRVAAWLIPKRIANREEGHDPNRQRQKADAGQWRPAGESAHFDSVSESSSASHAEASASLGIRQSPLGDRLIDPTLGPSGKHDRLYCWAKNL